jgi:hypothetical protein
VFLTINFGWSVPSAGANLFIDVRRDDGHSLTNGRQLFLADESGGVGLFESNTIIADLQASLTTRLYNVEMVNLLSVALGVRYYSITSESI